MEHKGYNSSYSKGYEDGLSSGRHASGALGSTLQKNTYRYADDDQYRQGWDDGYDVGKTQEQQWKEDLNNSMRRIKPKKSK